MKGPVVLVRAVLLATVVVLLAGLALVACGGSGAPVTTSPSPTSPVTDLGGVPSLTDVMSAESTSSGPSVSIPTVQPGEKPPAFAVLRTMFAYDETEPLGYTAEASGMDVPAGTVCKWITFQSQGSTATGYLVTPKGAGPYPVVLFAHGWGMGAEHWLDQAGAVARKGYASLLVDEVGSSAYYTYDADLELPAWVQYVIQTRRALDLIETLPQLDASRIGFVGLSNGGTLGGLLAGVDDRVKAYVLLGAAGMLKSGQWERRHEKNTPIRSAAAFARWKARVSVIDYVTYVSHARGRILFLAGNTDTLAVDEARDCLAAAPARKTLHVYKGDHYPVPAAANAYWRAWMVRNL